jgi:N-acyl-D-amino-acid deacylase
MDKLLMALSFFLILVGCNERHKFDVLIRNGKIADGSAGLSYTGDVGINGDTIAAIGNLEKAKGSLELDASGLIVAPGFINMLSWSVESLIEDGRSMSDIKQGVTLEVFGEGLSWGPLTEDSKKEIQNFLTNYITYDIEWTTLGEYLDFLINKGVSCNVASFVGGTTLRINAVGYENRPAESEELDSMKSMLRKSMEEGALGLGTFLIYPPGFYADTEELIELCKVVSEYNGMYISHIRSEGNNILQSIDELLKIAKEANIRSEIHHFKQAGISNWSKYGEAVSKIDSARNSGLKISANMYTYTAGSSHLGTTMPPWVQEGGFDKWVQRLKDPDIRKKVLDEMISPTDEWENFFLASGSPDNILLIGFNNDSLKYLNGKTLADIAKMRNIRPEQAVVDLVIEDGSRVWAAFYMMSEENVKKQIALPWMSFGSDHPSMSTDGVFLRRNYHPRAYGTFSRLLAKYVRDEEIITLEEAVRRLSSLPAENLKIKKRGMLKVGYYADLAIFDLKKVQDLATFEDPHQYSTGMIHVFVNGSQVLKDGEHTGAFPGRVVHGPGWIQ